MVWSLNFSVFINILSRYLQVKFIGKNQMYNSIQNFTVMLINIK